MTHRSHPFHPLYHPSGGGAVPPGVTVDWGQILGIPATFPPSAHTHLKADITDFAHTHLEADITDLKAYAELAGAVFTGNVETSSNIARFILHDTGAGTNNKRWDFRADSSELKLRTINDANNMSNDVFVVSRTGIVVDKFALLTDLEISSTGPRISWNDTDEGTADEKRWEFTADFGRLTLRTQSDDEAFSSDVFTILRTGIQVDQFDIKATLLTHNGFFLAREASIVNLSINKSSPLYTLNNTGSSGAASLHFAESGASRFIMGSQFVDGTFKLNIGGSIFSRNDFVMDNTGKVSFGVTPVVGGTAVSLVGHTHDHGALTGLGDDDHPQYALLSGQNIFTGTTLAIVNAAPKFRWEETGVTADNSKWDLVVNAEALLWRINSDDFLTDTEYLRIERTGLTVDSINLTATLLQHNGTDIFLKSGGTMIGDLLLDQSTVTPNFGTALLGIAAPGNGATSVELSRVRLSDGTNNPVLITAATETGQIVTLNATSQLGGATLNIETSNVLRLAIKTSLADFRVDVRVQKFGANNVTPITKPTVTGPRGGNAALASLLTAMANYGLITNSTTA